VDGTNLLILAKTVGSFANVPTHRAMPCSSTALCLQAGHSASASFCSYCSCLCYSHKGLVALAVLLQSCLAVLYNLFIVLWR